MTTLIDACLRAGTGGYLGRRFSVYIELLGAPEQVQTRNYGDDAFVIVTPSEKPRMYDIRHAYLHFQIDPIMIKYGMDLQQKRFAARSGAAHRAQRCLQKRFRAAGQ